MRLTAFALLLACYPPLANCEVKLPGFFSSHVVLQREMAIHIWGWAAVGEKVSVSLHGVTRETAGDSLGDWSVYFPPEVAGGPYQLTVTASNSIALDDVMIGDVWFAAGQSNMEMPLKGWPGAPLKDSAAEIAAAANPQIRLLHIPMKVSDFPLHDAEASWQVCSPETVADFSAAAYFFGRDLAAREHVPIGLIDDTWGGTVVEAWMSLDAISADASLMPLFATRARMMQSQAEVQAILAREHREDAAAHDAGKEPPYHPWHPGPASWSPAAIFNGMIAPLTPYGIKGVIWYQGESNSRTAFAPMYAREFPALIADWRTHWRQGSFPFIYVQISAFTSVPAEVWAVIREAQRRALSVIDTAMVVSIDVGDPTNVHPADKQTIGARLALAARALAYGEKVEYSGPLFRQATVEGDTVRVWFDHAASSLVAKPDVLTGFEVAGEDGNFIPASARIDGKTVVATSAKVPEPKFVRYAWANAPAATLFNSEGLPASPFTSEDEIPPR